MQRLNDSQSTNVLKFSSEYGTFNTVQLGDDMINRSSDYGGTETTSRQSQKATEQNSGVISPNIQIQSVERESAMCYEPANMNAHSANTTKAGNKMLI